MWKRPPKNQRPSGTSLVESIQGRGSIIDHGASGVPSTVNVPCANAMSTATRCREGRDTKRKRGVPERPGQRPRSPD